MTDLLPVWQITQGLPFALEMRVLDGPDELETPLENWLDYTATFKIADDVKAESILSGTASIIADGYLTISLSEAQTATLVFDDDRTVIGQAQVTITDDEGETAFVLQAPVRLTRSMK